MAHDLSKGLKRRGKIGFLDRNNGISGTKYGPNSPFVPRNNPKLLAEYFENESTGGDSSRLLDTSRFGTRRTGEQGRCYTADGTDDEVIYGDIGSVIWFSGWIKLNSDNQCLFSLSNDTNTNLIVSSGVLTAGVTLTLTGIKVDGVTKTASEAGVLLNDNLWHFLSCGIGDGLGGGSTADDVRFFTDGTNHGSVSGFDWRFYSSTPTTDELMEAYAGKGARNMASMSKYALWDKMDTQGGIGSHDSSGNGLIGIITNATLSTFHDTQDIYSFQNQVGYNKRMYFDGIDDRLDIPDSSQLRISNGSSDSAFEVEAEIFLASIAGVSPIVIKDISLTLFDWAFFAVGSSIRFLVGSGVNSSVNYIGANAVGLTVGKSVVKATYDGSGAYSGIKIYLNGAELVTTDISTGSYSTGSVGASVSIGRRLAFSTQWVRGIISNVVITKNGTVVFESYG